MTFIAGRPALGIGRSRSSVMSMLPCAWTSSGLAPGTSARMRAFSLPGGSRQSTWSPGSRTVSAPATMASSPRKTRPTSTPSGRRTSRSGRCADGESSLTSISTSSMFSRLSESSGTKRCDGSSCWIIETIMVEAQIVASTSSRSKVGWLRGSLTRATTLGTWYSCLASWAMTTLSSSSPVTATTRSRARDARLLEDPHLRAVAEEKAVLELGAQQVVARAPLLDDDELVTQTLETARRH